MPNASERNVPLRGLCSSHFATNYRISGSGGTDRAEPSPTADCRVRCCRSPSACHPSARATGSALASFFEWALELGPEPGQSSAAGLASALSMALGQALASGLSTVLEQVLGPALVLEPF